LALCLLVSLQLVRIELGSFLFISQMLSDLQVNFVHLVHCSIFKVPSSHDREAPCYIITGAGILSTLFAVFQRFFDGVPTRRPCPEKAGSRFVIQENPRSSASLFDDFILIKAL
jgi:hypothetical protein